MLSLLVTCIVNPWLVIAVVILVVIFGSVVCFGVATTRDLRRLEAVGEITDHNTLTTHRITSPIYCFMSCFHMHGGGGE